MHRGVYQGLHNILHFRYKLLKILRSGKIQLVILGSAPASVNGIFAVLLIGAAILLSWRPKVAPRSEIHVHSPHAWRIMENYTT
jgi:hypothetical protein